MRHKWSAPVRGKCFKRSILCKGGCGCGELLTGNGKMKFVNGTHRKRAWAQNRT